ncbi:MULTISPECIES: right-handed parallel beta-helix repeat-containing protein [unclassified Micromonospora]|uniref:right-handed parallel beta-helix repeat-containing protein n=1 Tax=unclassified Micromonospora TaxID=2617518 RepID=UPI002FF00E89
MQEKNTGRRALLRGTAVAATAAVAAPFVGAASAAEAAATSGLPWVGPAGSGATWEVNTTTGAQGAINTALNAVGPQGAVFIAAGTYYVKAPIVLLDKQTLVGAGPLSTLLKAASGFTGGAMVTGTATRMCIRDIGLDGVNLAANGVNLQIATKPTQYGPDPAPWLCRVFVANTTSDGIYLGGAYPGGQREFKLTDCRVEKAGGWAYNLQSSDGFVSGCSAQGGGSGGYLIGGGNMKLWGCKAYGTGSGPTPGPAFKVASSRATIVGCEAQDTYGCGFEVSGRAATLSGCTADSTGVGTNDRYSAGFFVEADVVNIDGCSFQRDGGGASWIGALGMRWALHLSGAPDYLSVRLVSDPARPAPFQGTIFGTAGSHSSISVLG